MAVYQALLELADTVEALSIEAAIRDAVVEQVEIERILTPGYTTDWITKEGRDKLWNYGIAPPEEAIGKGLKLFGKPTVSCPQCGSTNTEKLSEFGSTVCKGHYRCLACADPFDSLKCI